METDHEGVADGARLTPEALTRRASFKGWDFDDVWRISEGRDHPRLRWEQAEETSP
jgi:hypothetical protein